MNLLSPLSLAAVELPQPHVCTWPDIFSHDKLTVVGAIGVVLLPVVVWAVFIRKRRRRRSHRSYPANSAPLRSSRSEGSGEHKHSRRRRRHHSPRNPTLAETGGLPPVRSPQPTETTV
jgi:hypothetical protein